MEAFWLYCLHANLDTTRSLMLKDIIEKNGSFDSYEEYEETIDTLESYSRVVTGVLGTRGKIYVPYTFRNEYNVSLSLSNMDKYIESTRRFIDKYGDKNVKKMKFYFNSDDYKYLME